MNIRGWISKLVTFSISFLLSAKAILLKPTIFCQLTVIKFWATYDIIIELAAIESSQPGKFWRKWKPWIWCSHKAIFIAKKKQSLNPIIRDSQQSIFYCERLVYRNSLWSHQYEWRRTFSRHNCDHKSQNYQMLLAFEIIETIGNHMIQWFRIWMSP